MTVEAKLKLALCLKIWVARRQTQLIDRPDGWPALMDGSGRTGGGAPVRVRQKKHATFEDGNKLASGNQAGSFSLIFFET